MAKNKGYTLIEMIIVITIMAVLSATTFVVMGVIKNAKRTSAVDKFDTQLSACLVQTKAVSKALNGTDRGLCMVIRKRTDGKYALMTGYIVNSSVVDKDGNALNPNNDNACDAIMEKEISKIEYSPSATSQKASIATADQMIIQYVKTDGSLKYGAGTYKLYTKRNGSDALHATVYLDAVSGNHHIQY